MRQKKSKSQYRAPRPPLPGANKVPQTEQKQARRVGNIRSKRLQSDYNTDIENPKRQSRIPRLSQASEDRIPKPKKYISDSEYKDDDPSLKKQPNVIRRSQSFLSQNPKVASAPPVDFRSKIPSLPTQNAQNPKNSQNQITPSKPEYANGVGTRRSVNYKPRTLREYKEMMDKEDPFTYKVRGGLGANIGGEEWQKEHEKRQRMKEFANRVKKNQGGSDPMRRTSQSTAVETQEK